MNEIDVKVFGIEQLFGPDGNDRYVVSLYQREYAWGETEIRQLLDDLWESFETHPARNYHLGTLVVCRRFADGDLSTFELIDGQQRLTTLSLLYRLIRHQRAHLTRKVRFDNRPKAEGFLDAFFADARLKAPDPASFSEAVDNLVGYRYSGREDASHMERAGKDDWLFQFDDLMASVSKAAAEDELAGVRTFSDFVLNKVKLFRVEMPSTTDVSAYFEVMNNRGRQLEFHELVKARLIAKLRNPKLMEKHGVQYDRLGELERRFDICWSECSNMNGHLAWRLHGCLSMERDRDESWCRLKDGDECNYSLDLKESSTDRRKDDELQSIIDDFPNFLMHVLRLYLQDKNIPLDDRKLDEAFRNNESRIDPYEFLDVLLRTRLWFDRHVVKVRFEDKAVAEWRLEHVARKADHYQMNNTFSDYEDRELLIKVLSVLQATFRTRRYKEWLSQVLFEYVSGDSGVMTAEGYFVFLEQTVLKDRIKAIIDDNVYSLGTATPHLLLNVIDYLLWREDRKGSHGSSARKCLKDFVFAYRSSIEHHHPQHIFEGEDKADPWTASEFNDIGNLCLVYPGENSSLSNHSPKEKVLRFANSGRSAPPKQQCIYDLTMKDQNKLWTKKNMLEHSKHVQELVVEFIGAGDEKTSCVD